MKKSKDPPDFREQWSKDELRKRQERRTKADLKKDPRHRFLTRAIWIINGCIVLAVAWVIWLTYKFLIEKGII